ncbi:hypothetical protein GCM10010191_01680 [Actinomadura vinacea]|uniref:Uncharacterized protein n=1 Tax=Actinomadura vinacea TaxID=115336 RepID=A0ABN3I9Z1_9ACTN
MDARDPDRKFVPMGDEERNENAFSYIAASMHDSALPAKLRAAMYGAMAKIPDVRYEPRASDLEGRPGVTRYRQGGDLHRPEHLRVPGPAPGRLQDPQGDGHGREEGRHHQLEQQPQDRHRR